jgi:alkylhydroperoxidase family enzyme
VRHEHDISEDLYEHVADYATSDLYTEAEKVAVEYADRFATDHLNIDDDLFARLGSHYSQSEIVELTVTVARNLAIGRLLKVLELDLACKVDLG